MKSLTRLQSRTKKAYAIFERYKEGDIRFAFNISMKNEKRPYEGVFRVVPNCGRALLELDLCSILVPF